MTTIKLRRGTAAQWAASNPVLAAGEPGLDTTAGLMKVGDGSAPWSDLEFITWTSDSLTDLLAEAAGRASVSALLEAPEAPPIFIPHGGNNLGYGPDSTAAWYEAAASYDTGHLDHDVYSFTGCTTDLATLHNPTIDAATTGSGPVADLTPQAFRALKVDASSWYRQGWGDAEKLITFVDTLVRYGNRVIHWPEIKNRQSSVTDPVLAMKHVIERFNLRDSVVICSAHYDTCKELAADGYHVALVASKTQVTGLTPAGLLGDGIRFLHLQAASFTNHPDTGVGPEAASDATFQTFINGGVKVIPWTLGRQSEVKRYLDMGCAGAFITSPYAAGDPSLYRRKTDPLNANRQYVAPFLTNQQGSSGSAKDDTYSDDFRGVFGEGRYKSVVAGGAGGQYVLQAWACPLADAGGTYAITAEHIIDTPHSDLSRLPIAYGLCCPTDAPFRGDNSAVGYKVYLRGNGQIQGYRYTGTGNAFLGQVASMPLLTSPPVLSTGLIGGAAISTLPVSALPGAVPAGTRLYLPTTGGAGGKGQIVTVSTGGAALGATSIPIASVTPTTEVPPGAAVPQMVPVQVTVTPSTITFKRTDTNESLVATDSAYRGGYFFIGKENGGSGNLVTSYRSVTVT
ncbi:hypothetical protein JK386_00610 [Nocardioides sp. zg-536]|uniref:Major tropism determinant N-terminal domain-containing protein n=1 Tax=Nocardioides faecalis TaxID=2803858 RepID=A0A938Y5S5_9ACTN|nr:hypothetical protein [Nocardioides faecalis]MBM9458400.1 hypothetical protein [Nocardioides faecalis]QVI58419.1 hypothetical protein KG111_15690 [Nocardioides faecalis]